MSEYTFDPVWPAPSEVVGQEVVDFWLREAALPNRPAAEQRAHELVVVARDERGSVAGVSTAVPAKIAQLGFECFYYRMFVGHAERTRGLRSTDLARKVLVESYQLLNERFHQGMNSNVLGLYLEIENPIVMRVRNEAVWHDYGANVVYIGKSPNGKHRRVWYFEGARIP